METIAMYTNSKAVSAFGSEITIDGDKANEVFYVSAGTRFLEIGTHWGTNPDLSKRLVVGANVTIRISFKNGPVDERKWVLVDVIREADTRHFGVDGDVNYATLRAIWHFEPVAVAKLFQYGPL